MKNKFGVTKDMIFEVVKETSKRMTTFNKFRTDNDLNLSNKNISEILGKLSEKVCADVFTKHLGYEVKRATSDQEPDLFFTKIKRPLEIKMTSTDNAWTGGEFSKRPFDYLLISWGGNFDEYFVVMVHLEKKDWKSNISKQFYGPSYSARKLFTRKDKIVFLGKFNDKGTVIIREKI